MHTPWGPSQIIEQVAPGIQSVITAGHGGFKLDPALNAQVPEVCRRRGGWYEEDCEWAIPFLIFPELFEEAHDHEWPYEMLQQNAVETLREYNPDAYEFILDDTLGPGESWAWDQRHGLT